MKRIIMHWSAGGHKASSVDRQHYHLMIEGNGNVVYGDKPISANAAPLSNGYAAHTAKLNTDSIGIAVCAMTGSRQVPFDPGKAPITEAQVGRLVREVARLAHGYGIPVTRQTVLSHAEVQPVLGVPQAGKWDIAWIPGWKTATDPVSVGDYLRDLIRAEVKKIEQARPPTRPVMVGTSVPYSCEPIWSGFWTWLKSLFGG